MAQSKLIKLGIGLTLLILTFALIFSVRTCNRPVTNPTINRLQNINDSLYAIIQANNIKTDSLFAAIDSLNQRSDTIIMQQQITNKYYKDETYNILNATPDAASKQFRTTLKKSDSLLKAGFYARTYDLRSAAFQSKLQ